MTQELQYIATITLIFIVTVFWIASKTPQKPPKDTKTKYIDKPRSVQVIDTLDWMLENNIITPQEYSKLIGKSLPFLE